MTHSSAERSDFNQSHLSTSETAALTTIDTWLDYRIRSGNALGYQLCIRKNGQIIFEKAYGHREDGGLPLNVSDRYCLGSQTKAYTSCIVLKLIELGKLSFSTKLIEFVPELFGHKDTRLSTVTVADLLSHRAGLARDYEGSIFEEKDSTFPRDATYSEVIESLKKESLIYDPQTKTKYSNAGYVLLGLIAERASGMSYQELIETYINSQLHESDVVLAATASTTGYEILPGHTHRINGGQRLRFPCIPMKAGNAAAGVCASSRGASEFFHELLFGQRLISAEMQQRLVDDLWVVMNYPASKYGYGLICGRVGGETYLGHVGEFPGYSTQTFAIGEGKYVISLCMNTCETLGKEIFTGITKILLSFCKLFEDEDSISVSDPMIDKWHSFILVVGKKTALCVPLETWTPHRSAVVLLGDEKSGYISQSQDGYWNVGEKLVLIKDETGRVCSVRWGNMQTRTETDFLKSTAQAIN